jgi:Protein of unknown function (DUF2917)
MFIEHPLFYGALPSDCAPRPATHQHAKPCGSFALRAGRALSLRPKVAALLRITQGAAWVTLPSLPGDHFLRAGDSLHARAGDHVVMEAWPVPAKSTPTGTALYFDWDPVPMRVAAPARTPLFHR